MIDGSLLMALKDLPVTMRAEIIAGEIIVNARTPPLWHALAIRHLREALGRVEDLIPLERTSVMLPATEEAFIPDLAYYSFKVLDPDIWLVPANALVMAVEVLSGKATALRPDATGRTRRTAMRHPECRSICSSTRLARQSFCIRSPHITRTPSATVTPRLSRCLMATRSSYRNRSTWPSTLASSTTEAGTRPNEYPPRKNQPLPTARASSDTA